MTITNIINQKNDARKVRNERLNRRKRKLIMIMTKELNQEIKNKNNNEK